MDLLTWVSPAYDTPAPEGLATPLLGAAVLAAVVWRLSLWSFRRRMKDDAPQDGAFGENEE